MMVSTLILDGLWDIGSDRGHSGRHYDGQAPVPGLATDPTQMNEGSLWYRRRVHLPVGDWTHATLVLKGARFCPTVYVDGEQVSESGGGMIVTRHLLRSDAVRPDAEVVLEIALQSLADVSADDASRIPDADLWRSNVSSCLWDSVTLRLHGPARLVRAVPMTDYANDCVRVAWRAERLAGSGHAGQVRVEIVDAEGVIVAEASTSATPMEGVESVDLDGACQPWSPEEPHCYTLRTTLLGPEGDVLDSVDATWGLKDFGVDGSGLLLNGEPFTFRSATVVWHRWLRDPEVRELAFDERWFEENIVRRLKAHGANGLRFHLGTPPEALLDLCDRYGLVVQAEWSFFHGIAASYDSLVAQWHDWFDLLMQHPSTGIIHAWNETHGDDVTKAMRALDAVAADYPPLVLSHRDVTHVHKYWWSLFENLGLYYDSAAELGGPAVADEFGGNYLDGDGNPGGYPTLRGSLLRFLGRGHTRENRLRLHTEANTQVAEYWRRLGVAGFSPFCALGGPEDGCHHFLGRIEEGRPKDVWEGLTAAYSPVSCSLEVWDRNYVPGQSVELQLYLFNDTAGPVTVRAEVRVVSAVTGDRLGASRWVTCSVPSHRTRARLVELSLPDEEGDWEFQAVLQDPPAGVKHVVVSRWRVRTLRPRLPDTVAASLIAVPEEEEELRAFLGRLGIRAVPLADTRADCIVTSSRTWERLRQCDEVAAGRVLGGAIAAGTSVVMLDVGPRYLGEGYRTEGRIERLTAGVRVEEPRVETVGLFGGLTLTFREVAEPESCVHPSAEDDSLWAHLAPEATQLWNGLRGGLVAPAADMEITGLSGGAYVSSWVARGAPADWPSRDSYYAFELGGQYVFSEHDLDTVRDSLRDRVRFLVADAPSLEHVVNPEAPIRVTDLSAGLRAAERGTAEGLLPLANCGMNLLRSPVMAVTFGAGRGTLVLSQLLTAGRLGAAGTQGAVYDIRTDPAAQQVVLNMLAASLADR